MGKLSQKKQYEERCVCPCEDRAGCAACDQESHDVRTVRHRVRDPAHCVGGRPA